MNPEPADVPMITPAQVERLADAAFLTDPNGMIAVWNRAATELLGHPASRAVGGRCAVLLAGC
jgi:PAS domain-containing protein